MFKKKKNHEKPSILTEKYSLDELYVAEMGIKISGTIKSRETIICRCKKDSYGHHIYTDLLTKNKYRLYSDYYAENGETIVFNPRSFMSILKNGPYKDNLLNNGCISKDQLIQVYNALNDGIGYIESREDKNKRELADACNLLTDKNFTNEPAIHFEEELERIMISLALNKKIALIVGDKGIGTTTLVEQLAYLIQKGQVPDFLKNKNIIEVNIPRLKVKDSKKRIENRIKTVIDAAKEMNAILFIDEADDIVTPKEENEDNLNTLAMLRFASEREGIKIIATTNSTRYKEYERNLEFKRQFDIIKINKPNEEVLTEIINQKFTNYSQNTGISITSLQNQLPEIVTLLISATSENNTMLATTDENPGLVVSIVDKSFAIANGKKEKELTLDHLKRAIAETKQLDQNKIKKASSIIEALKISDYEGKQLRK